MNRLVVVDLEATCWERGFKSFHEMEIIEIGALLIDIAGSESISEFDEFVRPVINPVLSDFCRELTSIRQEDVAQADTFPDVWQRFLAWMKTPSDILMSSWGNYDRWQFKLDCRRNGINYIFDNRHLNIKDICRKKWNRRRFGLSSALRYLELEFEGIHHRGIDDARNIWKILKITSHGNLRALIDDHFTEQMDLFESS